MYDTGYSIHLLQSDRCYHLVSVIRAGQSLTAVGHITLPRGAFPFALGEFFFPKQLRCMVEFFTSHFLMVSHIKQ